MEYAAAMAVVVWWLYTRPGPPASSKNDLNQDVGSNSRLRDSRKGANR
jgi:hypothetical protein